MRFNEFSIKANNKHSVAPTPQQACLNALKIQKDNVSKALHSERKRQKVAKAQKNLRKAVSAQQGKQSRVKHPHAGLSAVSSCYG